MKSLAKLRFIVVALAIMFALATNSFAQVQHYDSPLYSPRAYERPVDVGLPDALNDIGIEQKLNSQLPLDATLLDEEGNTVQLKQYFGSKPVILAMVYYECPMLCNEVLNGLVGSLKPLTFNAGNEFEVVAVSFDPKDTPEIAKAKKEGYTKRYGREGTEKGWHFLTATPETIARVTEAVGFSYKWDEKTKQYAHAGGIMIATPEGKLSHYFYGIEYAPKDVRLGLVEAAGNKIGNPVDKLLLYCYHYDPSTGKYGLAIMNVMRLGGVITVLGLITMLLILWKSSESKKARREEAV